MQKSIKVGDYFDNDDNGVWSWYLSHIRNGDFEEFSRNKLKVTLLRRFLNSHFDSSNNHYAQDTKILFVSIPDKVHRDLSLLENFLRDYFHLEHLEHIEITKLTQSRVYNHENHYILVDKLNNFDDPAFLQFASSKWQQQLSSQQGNRYPGIPAVDINKRSGGVVTEMSPAGSPGSGSTTNGPPHVSSDTPMPQNIEVRSIQSESTTEQFNQPSSNSIDDTEDETDSICLNFSHSVLRKQIEEKKLQAMKEAQQVQKQDYSTEINRTITNLHPNGKTNSTDINTNPNSGEIYSPVISENVSINSYEDESVRDGSDSITARDDYSGQPLTLTTTQYKDETQGSSDDSQEENISELSSVSRSMKSLGSQTSLGDDVDLDNGSDSSDYSVVSILPSISISDARGHYRLVMQSSLLQDPETKEVYTAIRQSNNQPTVADIEDDWLLYDSQFSMNNLQMLTLQELLDMNRSFPKIIFYSMIVVSDEQDNLLQWSNGAVTDPQDIQRKPGDNSPPIPRENSYTSVSREPQQFYANMDDDDTSLSEQSGPMMYAPTRVQSNATTAHRSIRTVNSIGDWAFVHKNEERGDESRGKVTNEAEVSGVHLGTHNQGLQFSYPERTPSRNGLSKVSTMASLNPVERSKSVPLPTVLRSFSNVDGEPKHWKDKISTFRRKKNHRQHEKGCIIM